MKNRNKAFNKFALVLAVMVLLALVQAAPAHASDFDLEAGHIYILRSGGNPALYVRCDVGNWHCAGTRDRSKATRFVARQASGSVSYNVREPMGFGGLLDTSFGANQTRNWQMRVKGSDLCLDVWWNTWDVNLYNCASDVTATQGFYMIENVVNTHISHRVTSTHIGSAYHGVLRWNGAGKQLVMVGACGQGDWQCDNWHFEPIR